MADPTFRPLPSPSSTTKRSNLRLWLFVGLIVVLIGGGALWQALDKEKTSTNDLKIGMCLRTMPGDGTFREVDTIDCDESHVGEVYDTGTYVFRATLPSTLGTLNVNVGGDVVDATLDDAVQRVCIDEQVSRRREALIDANARITSFKQADFSVSSKFFCVATFDEARKGSVTEL